MTIENEHSEEEKKYYNNTLKDLYYIIDLDKKPEMSTNQEEKETINKYLSIKVNYLKEKITYNKNYKKELKKELIEKFGNTKLSKKEISTLEDKIEINRNENYIEGNMFNFNSKYDIKLSQKDIYLQLKRIIKQTNKKLSNYKYLLSSLNSYMESQSLIKKDKKTGFYLIESINQKMSIKDDNINDFNSVFVGVNELDKTKENNEESSEDNIDNFLLSSKNRNNVANLIPELEYESSLPQKKYIAVNGYGNRGGLFEKNIEASCFGEALLKLNEWAKKEQNENWSLYHMTEPCSSGLVNIYEVKDNTIK